jgi:hypothetical protein
MESLPSESVTDNPEVDSRPLKRKRGAQHPEFAPPVLSTKPDTRADVQNLPPSIAALLPVTDSIEVTPHLNEHS